MSYRKPSSIPTLHVLTPAWRLMFSSNRKKQKQSERARTKQEKPEYVRFAKESDK